MTAAPPEPEPAPAYAPPRRSRMGLVVAAAAAVLLLVVALAVPYAVAAYRDLTRPTLDALKIYEVRSDHTEKEVEYDPAPPPGGPCVASPCRVTFARLSWLCHRPRLSGPQFEEMGVVDVS